jgi:hypothetical protein
MSQSPASSAGRHSQAAHHQGKSAIKLHVRIPARPNAAFLSPAHRFAPSLSFKNKLRTPPAATRLPRCLGAE